MLTDVTRCARCGGNHTQILFTQLSGQSIDGATLWGMCPTLNQPILMTVRQKVEVVGPQQALPNQGGTPTPKGSITRLASASLLNNTNPWVATCGVCHSTVELGQSTITLPTDLTGRGWLNSDRLGWVCSGCQKFMKPTDNCWLTAENR